MLLLPRHVFGSRTEHGNNEVVRVSWKQARQARCPENVGFAHYPGGVSQHPTRGQVAVPLRTASPERPRAEMTAPGPGCPPARPHPRWQRAGRPGPAATPRPAQAAPSAFGLLSGPTGASCSALSSAGLSTGITPASKEAEEQRTNLTPHISGAPS